MSKEFDEWLNEYLASWVGGQCSVKNLAYACYYRGMGDGAESGKPTPEHPTMHPDLMWLVAEVSKQGQHLERYVKAFPNTVFYRKGDKVASVQHPDYTEHHPVFSWAEIEQARRYLAEQPREAPATLTATRLKELEMERDELLARDAEHERILSELGLNNLPDYETWFETHGSERTVKHRLHPLQEATVHELYTYFRARLLDELRQAGVIGEE